MTSDDFGIQTLDSQHQEYYLSRKIRFSNCDREYSTNNRHSNRTIFVLNRSELRINVTSAQDIVNDPNFNSGKTWGGAQVVSIREVEIDTSNKETFIVVDDLDHGFSIEGSFKRWNFQPMTRIARRLAGKTVIEQSQGLPAFQFDGAVVPSDTWERKTDTTAYGKYWKTLAITVMVVERRSLSLQSPYLRLGFGDWTTMYQKEV